MVHHLNLIGTLNQFQTGKRLDQALVEIFPNYSRSRIKDWILNGLVRVNEQITIIPKTKVLGSELIKIQVSIKKSPSWKAQSIPLDVIYEDQHILIINKPQNLVIHPSDNTADGTVLNALLNYYPPLINVPRAGIVHRLDKNTTGLVLIAKTVLTQKLLVNLLQARQIIREYEAIVIGIVPSSGTITQPIARHMIKRTQMTVHPKGKPAITHYRIIEYFRAHTYIKLHLETGRTHQIRVHTNYIGYPLVGDPIYGTQQKLLKGASKICNECLCNFNRQALHAKLLQFYHPMTSVKMRFYAPLPHDMVALIMALQVDANLFKNHIK